MSEFWTTLDTKHLYENAWISLREDAVLNPNGGKGIYGVVHFKNLAIAVVPVDENGYTVLIGQHRYTLNEYSWEVPMGGGKIGLNPLESAKRELEEEAGLRADKWTCIAKVHTSNSVTDETGYIYLAENLSICPTAFDETELLELKKIHFSEVLQMCMTGQITDALSLCAVFKIALLRPEWLKKSV